VSVTIGWWARLVATKVLWWSRGRVQSWRALRTTKLWCHAVARWRLLGRRRQSRTTLRSTACHYSTKEVARSMADLGRLGLRRAVVL
jgi:hypothetical protein